MSSTQVRPLEDRVIVKPLEAETKTASGIFLPESAKERPMQGKVVATGPGKMLDNGTRMAMMVKKGDTVEIKNVKHIIVRDSELLGVLDA